jgi:Tfp pilus assembly protein PilX
MKSSPTSLQKLLFKLLLKYHPKQRSEGGYIIVVVMGMIIAMSTMLLTAALTSKVDNNSTRASGNSAGGFYAAEAGLNVRAKDIRSRFVGYNVPTGTSPGTVASCNPTGAGTGDMAVDTSLTVQDPLHPNDPTKRIPVATYVVNANRTDSSGNSLPTSVTINSGEQFAGLNAQEFRYDVVSIACDRTNQPTASLSMRFKSRLVPMFQFAAFYNQDLDFSNPPSMTMNGPIHTNGSMYLNSGSNTLTINGALTMAGRFFRGERLNTTCNGTVNIFSPTPAPGGFQSLACGSGRREYTQADVNPTWGANQIKIGIPTLTLPPISTFNADSSGEYWNKADLRVVLRVDGSDNPQGIEVQTAAGTTDSAATNALLGNTCAPITTTLSANELATDTNLTVSSSTSFRLANASRDSKDGPALQFEPSGTSTYVNNSAIDNDSNVVNNARSSNTEIRISRNIGGSLSTGSVVRRATVWTSNTFWNYREKNDTTSDPTDNDALRNDAKRIRMLNVDMRALMSCARQLMGGKNLDDSTDGGLVWFLTVKGPNSNNVVTATPPGAPNTYGIRLYNGANLSSTNSSDPAIRGLTVVSDQAVYIRGDYNCGTTTFNANRTLTSCSNDNKKPAAVIGDTINVLSNDWPLDDSYSRAYSYSTTNPSINGIQNTTTPVYIYSFEFPSDGPGRLASSTTINAAFLAGIDLTGGGLNNYPRLHEDWFSNLNNSRATLTYRGSMVSLGFPRRVNARFCGSGTSWGTGGCNIYTPPTRNWDYDTDFNNAANLPPLTPRFVYLRQERFSRNYDRVSFATPLQPFAAIFPGSVIPAWGSPHFHF